MSVKITYFAHGTTTDNEKNIATGWLHGKLSKLGIEQAESLSRIVSNKHFDIVFSSDLRRALDTAKIVFGSRYQIIPDKRLRECNYGDFTGKPFEFDLREYIYKPFPQGESLKDVERRIADFLEFLKKNYNGKHVAVVAHQAPQLAIEVLVNGKTWEQAIDEDWRKNNKWQPGWEYILK